MLEGTHFEGTTFEKILPLIYELPKMEKRFKDNRIYAYPLDEESDYSNIQLSSIRILYDINLKFIGLEFFVLTPTNRYDIDTSDRALVDVDDLDSGSVDLCPYVCRAINESILESINLNVAENLWRDDMKKPTSSGGKCKVERRKK